MTPLRSVLVPGGVLLNLTAPDAASALDAVASKILGAKGVSDYKKFREVLAARPPPLLAEQDCGILLAHARTDAVSGLVFAAGRLAEPFPSSDGTPLRLVFVFGIPTALNADYLRTVGSIARVCADPDRLGALLAAPDTESFLDVLTSGERPI